MTRRKTLGLSTRAVHGNPQRHQDHAPVSPPIYQSSTFVNPVGQQEEVLYTRYGNNPNQVEIAAKLATLEGAENALFTGSGMGATALAHLAVLRPGDHLIASEWVYGGTRKLFTEHFTRLGIDVSLVDPSHRRGFKGAVRKNTRAIFVEMITNPLMRVLDLEPMAQLARDQGLALLVDSTFASPINCRPIEHGADIVIHSVTKYLNGHTDLIAGAVAGTSEMIEEVRQLMQVWGQALDPHAAWLIDRGMKTIAVRLERHNANGMAFARWASDQEDIAAVHYPGLPDHPDHTIAKRLLDGYGGMVGLEIKGGTRRVERLLRRLRLAYHAPSLGGVETLVSEPRLTSHASLTVAERAALGIPDGFIRVSLGIEDIADVIADFENALAG